MQPITKEKTSFTVWADGPRTWRAEPENFNGRQLARQLLIERLGVACFGAMRRPEFFGSFSVNATSEAEVRTKAQDVAAEYRRRIEEGVDQLVKCATCPFSAACYRVTMASKAHAS